LIKTFLQKKNPAIIWVVVTGLRKSFAAAAFILTLSFSALTNVMFVDYATANPIAPLHLPEIIINSNGTVTPETGYINRAGNVYTLTADITKEYSVWIKRSNIVFDGAGHTIDVEVSGAFSVDGYPAAYSDVGITLSDVNNVIVKNVKVSSNNIYAIYLHGSSNCLITGVQTGKSVRIAGSSNTITESNTRVYIFSGSNNLITRNNISDFMVGGGSSNMFFKNNFYLTDYPALFVESLWDNGSVGNYWSNYTIKYPNTSEIGNTGIGNTPYVIEREWYTTKDYPNVQNVDNYPIMCPYDIENDAIVFPIPEPTPTPEPEPFPVVPVSASVAVAVAVAGTVLLVYFKKRKR
jgi:parallel beta-helix repeat protein